MSELIEFSPLEGEKEFVGKQKRAYKFKRGVKLYSESTNVDLNPSPVLQPPSPRCGEGKECHVEAKPKHRMAVKLEKFTCLKEKSNSERLGNYELTNQLDSFATAQNYNNNNSLTEREGNNIPDKVFSLFTKPSIGISEAKVEPQSTETLSFRCWSERCRLMRGAVNYQDYKVAFTLAEVLITLGIIGVVAAMTLPSLVANYQKKQVVTQLKREYTVISNALQSARAEHGDPEDWELGEDNDIQAASDFADTYLLPYLQVIKKCGTSTSGECDYKSSLLNSLTLFNYLKYTRFILNDGAIVLVSTSTGVNTTFPKLIYVTIDINGYKRPNKSGKDVFIFAVALETTNDMYKPTGRLNANGQSQTREKILTDKNGCSKNSNGAYCSALIIKDNWEITKDYPW